MQELGEWHEGAVEALNRPNRLARWALALAGALALSVLGTVLLVRMDRSVEGAASVRPEGGTWKAQAPWPGTVAAVLVQEGAEVRTGDALYRMDPREIEIRRAGLASQKELAQRELEGRRLHAEQSREEAALSVTVAEIEAQRAELLRDRSRSDAALAKAQFQASEELARQHIISAMELRVAQAKQESMEAALDAAEKDVALARRKVEITREIGRRVESEQASALLTAVRALEEAGRQLDEQERRLAEAEVRSVCDGKAMLKVMRSPAMVQAGEVLAEVVPAGARAQLEIRLAASDVTDLAPGQPVRVRFAGRTDSVTGRVRSVGADAQVQDGRTSYKVLADFGPDPGALPFGLEGQATVVTRNATLAQLGLEWFRDMKMGGRRSPVPDAPGGRKP